MEAERPRPARPRRRVLVTASWAASAAVIAAMAAGPAASADDDGAPGADTIAYADPPEDA